MGTEKIVFEMIDNHYMIFPIIAAAFIAAGASKLICKKPLYRGLMEEYLKEDWGKEKAPKKQNRDPNLTN